jgi:hypothetical protein
MPRSPPPPPTPPPPQAGEQYTLQNLTDGYVGRYGDSYGARADDWLELDTADAGTPDWDDDEETCSGLVVGADLTIFSAAYGAAVDLQRQIVGARLRFREGSWRYGTAPRQLYTVAVSFVDVPTGGAAEFVPPAPGLFAPLPDDVFYPFTVTPQAIAASTSSVAAAATGSSARRRG